MTWTVIEGARIVTPTGVERGSLVVDGDRIAAIAPPVPPSNPDRRIDADGKFLLPGLVDLHGDDVEQHVFPRSEARVPVEMALDACDRVTLAAGITTKFHAVAFEETPSENRSLHLARELRDALADSDELLARHRFHARCEVSDADCVAAVRDAIEDGGVSLVSLMNHAPGTGQFDDAESFERRYADGSGSAEWDAESFAERRDCDDSVLTARVKRLVDSARDAAVPVASHDDERPATVDRMRRRGVSISEFPVTEAAAEAATDRGMTTVMGAPNLVRGGSLWGNLGVETAIAADAVDVLCSDYHPHSLLRAPFVDTGEPLHRRVARVTSAPADAVGLDDRGRIEPGAVADLVLVDPDPRPAVSRVLVGGDPVYRCGNGETVP
ncbi:alpha-D-ribose 1-methylphosphonate 5-triphosphate diphosphatase [Halostella sp. JP-L12]|uniref:alpha-D-ribose 1-methylphosphonate 5-triphosphate diphosphatase n=1 Tax=Halostella TaxID=1843185 RepID=UPI000EF77685|nr:MULTISPECIES: alpha-D-ribose 1-methylphosphonate 5-triphosphate diphosphatase [Halostella]NHN49784.1 alpha-D-ribose 1-methylphosphonate 5-triphosphate diphosphatase [Halostella sp. JP-L12]